MQPRKLVLYMKRLDQTESPIFVIFCICSLFPKAILSDFYSKLSLFNTMLLKFEQLDLMACQCV